MNKLVLAGALAFSTLFLGDGLAEARCLPGMGYCAPGGPHFAGGGPPGVKMWRYRGGDRSWTMNRFNRWPGDGYRPYSHHRRSPDFGWPGYYPGFISPFFLAPGYGYGYGYDYDYDYGYAEPYYGYSPRYVARPHVAGVRSCSTAARDLRARGYRNVKALDCAGTVYTFRAYKGGRKVTVTYYRKSGRIAAVRG